MKRLIPAILALAVAPLGACRGNDLGTGANTVDREYAKPAPDALKAARQSAATAEFKVISDKHDQMGGELVVSRGDGKEIRILVKSLTEKSSRVSVRVEPGDRDLATMMQERVAGNLGLGATTGGVFGGNSLDATYDADLASCMTSARRTIVALTPNTTSEESHATWCQVDGRQKDSTPVRIRMEKVDDKKTSVRFIAGTSKSDDNKAFIQKMKDEFELVTRPGAGSR